MDIKIKQFKGKKYKVTSEGTFFSKNTPDNVIRIIERARKSGARLRFHWGDRKTGRDWGDIYDTMGKVGRSMGPVKTPLIIANSRSMGGGSILTDSIVKIEYSNQKDGGVLYVHPKYHADADHSRHVSNPPRSKLPRSMWSKLKSGGAGGFLAPPTHPTHDFHIGSVYGDTMSVSLEYAVDDPHMDDHAKAQARGRLKRWERTKPPLKDPSIQDWIHQVLGYFKGCYKQPGGTGDSAWNAGNLLCDSSIDPIKNQDKHAGVHFIRKYYPEFKLTKDHLSEAYWGKKSNPTYAQEMKDKYGVPFNPTKLKKVKGFKFGDKIEVVQADPYSGRKVGTRGQVTAVSGFKGHVVGISQGTMNLIYVKWPDGSVEGIPSGKIKKMSQNPRKKKTQNNSRNGLFGLLILSGVAIIGLRQHQSEG